VSDTARCQVSNQATSDRDTAVPLETPAAVTTATKSLLARVWSDWHEIDTVLPLTENGV